MYIEKQFIIFEFPIFALLWTKIEFWPTVIRKGKITNFVKRASSPNMQLTECRFHANSKVHSLLWLEKYGNVSENSTVIRERAGRYSEASAHLLKFSLAKFEGENLKSWLKGTS